MAAGKLLGNILAMHFGFYLMIAALVIMGAEVVYALYQLANFFLWTGALTPTRLRTQKRKTPRSVSRGFLAGGVRGFKGTWAASVCKLQVEPGKSNSATSAEYVREAALR
jgi:hypothetical protein